MKSKLAALLFKYHSTLVVLRPPTPRALETSSQQHQKKTREMSRARALLDLQGHQQRKGTLLFLTGTHTPSNTVSTYGAEA